jgi:predicted transcriptional regulator
MDDITSQFIAVYNEIDSWLRSKTKASNEQGFSRLVDVAAHSHPGVKRHAQVLKRLATLRNFVVHEHSHQSPLATATQHALERLTKIRNELVSPPLLLSISNRSVTLCSSADPIGKAVKLMHRGSFSQLPVYDQDRFVGLLTAETVARWLASSLADGQQLVEEKAVGEVLLHQEYPDNHTFMRRSATVFEALAEFDKSLRRGARLDAILLTESGRTTESPLGIVTLHDIPKIQRAIIS